MADDAENVLELDSDLELETEDEIETDEQPNGEVEEAETEEEVFGFGDEEGAAPAQETESSVIRDLRRANRELAKKISRYERGSQAQPIEVGPKPTLESCDYDEERFETELDAWKEQKAKADRAEQEAEQRAEAERATWSEITAAYDADKKALKVANYADAEEEVFSTLSEQTQALLMKSGKGAQLVVALSRSPDKLQALSEMNLADAAMMIGELRGKLQMTTRKSLAPERRVTGNAGFASGGSSEKQLAKLKAKAEQTGDYSEYLAAKRAARA